MNFLTPVSAIAFFTAYLWVPGQPSVLEVPYQEAEGAVAFFIAGVLVSSAVLLVPSLVVLRWWTIPPFAFAVIWIAVNTAIAVSFSMNIRVALWFGIAGGLAGEVLNVILRPSPARRAAAIATLGIVPVVAWTAFLVATRQSTPILWPPEIWAGAVTLSGLAALGLGWLVIPDRDRGPNPVLD